MDKIKENQILRELLAGKTAKEVAFLCDCSVDPVYKVRDKYFTQRWVLKRHPKDTFKLES